jgi:hypothetical protein
MALLSELSESTPFANIRLTGRGGRAGGWIFALFASLRQTFSPFRHFFVRWVRWVLWLLDKNQVPRVKKTRDEQIQSELQSEERKIRLLRRRFLPRH